MSTLIPCLRAAARRYPGDGFSTPQQPIEGAPGGLSLIAQTHANALAEELRQLGQRQRDPAMFCAYLADAVALVAEGRQAEAEATMREWARGERP